MIRTFSAFLISLTVSFCLFAGNPRPFTIEGLLGPESDSLTLHMIYRDANLNTIQDSCLIVEGQFRFVGETEYPFFAEMYINRSGDISEIAYEDMLTLYVEPGDIWIESPDYLWHSVVLGSEINDLKYAFDGHLIPYQDRADKLNKQFQDADPEKQNDPAFIDSLNLEFEVISNDFYNAAMQFIADHPDDMLSVFLLLDHFSMQPNDENVEQVYNVLSDNVKDTPMGRRLESMIRMYKTLDNDEDAPDFTIDDVNGNPVSLSSLRGKYVLLVFWSPTCQHCLSEIPNMKRAYEMYKDKGLEIISFAMVEERDKQYWLDTVEDIGMPWPNIADFKGWESEIFQLYKAFSVPRNYLIDPEGIVVAKEVYGFALLNILEEIFRK